jgi:hypothetical protein
VRRGVKKVLLSSGRKDKIGSPSILSDYTQDRTTKNLLSSENLAIIYIESERGNLSNVNVIGAHCQVWEKEKVTMATKREMLNVIANGTMNDEVMAWAAAEIEKMNHANELRRAKVSKKAQENAAVVEAIVGVLTDEAQTASVIGAQVGISTQKASALLRQIVEAGRATKVDVKIVGKGTQKGYLIG